MYTLAVSVQVYLLYGVQAPAVCVSWEAPLLSITEVSKLGKPSV